MNTYIVTIHCSNISHKQYVVFFVCFALKYHSTLCSYKTYFDIGTKSCTEYQEVDNINGSDQKSKNEEAGLYICLND
jgi:hypothetical protein